MVHVLLQRQPVTGHQVMSFFSKTTFHANGQAQLIWLYHVIHSDMLRLYDSPTHLFLSFLLSLLAFIKLQRMSQLQQCLLPVQFPFPDVVIATDAMSHHWAFYILGSEVPICCCGTWSSYMHRVHIVL